MSPTWASLGLAWLRPPSWTHKSYPLAICRGFPVELLVQAKHQHHIYIYIYSYIIYIYSYIYIIIYTYYSYIFITILYNKIIIKIVTYIYIYYIHMYITISTTSSVDPTFLRHSPHQPLHHIPRTQRATLDLARETWSAQNAGKIRKLFWYDWDSLERGYFMWYVTNYDVWVCLKMWYMCSFDWGIWRYNIVSKSEGKP